ncbi:MAG: hypothetical protein WC891_08715 [Actinomycetota bacterium]
MKSRPLPITDKPIVTASVGKNAEQFADILRLYVPEGSVIADVTFGHGWFWKLVDNSKYTVLASDLSDRIFNPQVHAFDEFLRFQADMTRLPYRDGSLDVIVIDPPYGQGSTTGRKTSLARCYSLKSGNGPADIYEMYLRCRLSARRVLKRGGLAIIKCQDMVNNGTQFWFHCDIWEDWKATGWEPVDLFLMVQDRTPIMRHDHQVHARKNHSFWWIMRK